jgi:DNA-binding SARP family transcriptional activator/tetratricopeptide (TPR) repeat protein
MLALLWPDADDERGPRTLAQAIYALRKNLGAEDAITGAKELRFDPAIVTSDVSEFTSAVARGDDERAVAAYTGPFLDGFYLSRADELSRWIERERAALATEHSRVLESLARTARAAGDTRASVGWWRKLAALEPLNARVTMGLMEALAAAGDRAAALQHARVYELLIEQELDLPPDREVLAFAQRLRERADEPRATTAPEREPAPAQPARARWRASVIAAWIGVATVVVGGAAFVATRALSPSAPAGIGAGRVVAVGNIAAFGADPVPSALTAPLADLLTTSLARARAIRVVSHGRMLELMHSLKGTSDTTAGGLVSAARQAGATEVVDGTLYARPGGGLRLDLRRVDLATGAIGDVQTVEGSDLFALVDSGTTRLLASLGIAGPAGSVADVTTRSIAAYRLYEHGVRTYYGGDLPAALAMFDEALADDSLFALAAYYAALSAPTPKAFAMRMERARRLAARATDRERLMILAGWAASVSSPALRAIADTLAERYPTEVEGHLYAGRARVLEGDFLAGIPPLERAVAMDSLGLRGTSPRCPGCDAFSWIVGAYELADSLPAAERAARRWVRRRPSSETAVNMLVVVLEEEGRSRESDSAYQSIASQDRSYVEVVAFRSLHLIRAGDYVAADALLRAQLRDAKPQDQADALWNLVISLREQGRLLEAVDVAHRIREPTTRMPGLLEGLLPLNVIEAQAVMEVGRPATAAALFDSLAMQRSPDMTRSQHARNAAWMLTQAAGARFAAGDTSRLAGLADSIRALGIESGYGRDRRLHHHVRGLLFAARGDDRSAIGELEAAIYSRPAGYTRTNYELARVYLRAHRPGDAVAVLQPVLRGPLDASNLYLNRIELQELLAQAWDSAARPDSAAAHYMVVARTWAMGDPSFKARAQRAQARASELAGRH